MIGPNIDIYTEYALEQQGISLYPIPLHEALHIKSEEAIYSVTITNMQGSVFKATTLVAKEQTLSTGFLNPGMYIVSIQTTSGIRNFKVMKL